VGNFTASIRASDLLSGNSARKFKLQNYPTPSIAIPVDHQSRDLSIVSAAFHSPAVSMPALALNVPLAAPSMAEQSV
jgi:hypothetical protein